MIQQFGYVARDNATVRDDVGQIEALVQTADAGWLAFERPVRVLAAETPGAVFQVLSEVEDLTCGAQLHAVGFVAYEAGEAFGLPASHQVPHLPFAWFALFDGAATSGGAQPSAGDGYRLAAVGPTLDRSGFDRAFSHIRHHLALGDTYQANFTFKMRGQFNGDPLSLFADLVQAQRGGNSVYLRLGELCVCCASPELFFSREGSQIQAKPMKGTAKRGRTLSDDCRQRDALQASAKERAENVMIVDMVRNDLGRVAEIGSVSVPELFRIERYPNVWQMTSLVTARSTALLQDLFAAIHPSASVTGAPKFRTMEILQELEAEPRGVYTGAIGHVQPGGRARFSVAIRTAVVNLRAQTVEFGIGSGIVWDSDSAAEYEECLLKGSVLGRRPEQFELLETLRWAVDDGFYLLDRHIARLRDSAEYFGFVCERGDVMAALHAAVEGKGYDLRVRVRVAKDGQVRVESTPLVPTAAPLKVALASTPVDRADIFLFHKTTRRQVYDRARHDRTGFDEVVLWNRERQVTEATTANIVVEMEGMRVTPPIECGLLAGTFRAELLDQRVLQERIVTLEELQRANRLWLINSVQEWREATLVG